jgi:hypothetical protein
MRKLNTETRAAVLTALVEGNSIASACRMFGVNKITVLRLLADAGTLAADYHDLTVRELLTQSVQFRRSVEFLSFQTPQRQDQRLLQGVR